MESNTLVLTILIVVLLFKDYITSFFKEKGKNVATKQDIQDITKLIEGVRHEFETILNKQAPIIDERFKLVTRLNMELETLYSKENIGVIDFEARPEELHNQINALRDRVSALESLINQINFLVNDRGLKLAGYKIVDSLRILIQEHIDALDKLIGIKNSFGDISPENTEQAENIRSAMVDKIFPLMHNVMDAKHAWTIQIQKILGISEV